MWIADGIVSSTQDQIGKKRYLEDVADNYLNQLLQKGMIQVDGKDVDGRINTCSLHDLMRDKCLEMTREENFLQIVNITDKQKNSVDARTERSRHLTVYMGKEDAQSLLESLSGNTPFLRSVMFISTCTDEDRKESSCEWVKTIFKRFKLLRVLDFEGGLVLDGAFPKEVGDLIYLKYLCLRGTRVTTLPSSIKNLKSLLTLDLLVNRVVILPNVLCELSSLCCLYFPERILSQEVDNSQGYEIEDGSPLIPDKLSHLEMVSNVDLDRVEVEGLLELTSMRQLSASSRHKKENSVSFLESSSIKRLDLKILARLFTEDSNMLSESSTAAHSHSSVTVFTELVHLRTENLSNMVALTSSIQSSSMARGIASTGIVLLIRNADGKQNKNPLIRKWVSEVSDLALEAEDLTETYILLVSKRRQDEVLNGIKWLACFWLDTRILDIVGSIDGITSKISKMSSRLQTYGVRSSYDVQSLHTALTKKLLAEQRRTYAHAQPNYIVGLEENVAKLIKLLQEGPQKIVVAHGMGGIGKTALAREVYHRCLSQGHFVGCAWAYVSQQCNLGAVCKELLYELIAKNDKERNLINDLAASQLPGKLCEILKRNKYLVVLDDVWTSIDWRFLEPVFPIHNSSCGSKILVTTRNPQIISDLGDGLVSTWKVETLKEDSCWKLLENKGRFNRNELDSSMKDVAQKMLDHCNGHPLAIVALGGVLATKKSMEEWESVCENLQSHLQGDEESYSGVYDVLAMSYYDLHYNLKPCFLHMAHFPEDSRIDVEKLYNVWIADGIVSSTQDQIGKKRFLEDVAGNYLNQLLQKGMIQVDGKDVDGWINTCSLHDLMRDKCLEMTREENFLQIVNITEQQRNSVDARTERSRRLMMYVGKEDAQSLLESLSGKFRSLRSLVFISTCTDEDRKESSCKWVKTIFKRFKLLRILDFEGGLVLSGAFPKDVGTLIYLRYLCLRGTRITKLPSSIKNLKSLLILDLRVNRVVIKLPNVFWELSSLYCLYFPERILSQEVDNSQGYVIEDGTPLILDKLSHLERVNNIDLGKVDVKGLLELASMRKLSATCRCKKESLAPFLKSSSIMHLDLKIDAGLLTEDSNMLLSESNSLHILHIDSDKYRSTSIPIRVDMFPCNLVKLGFWYCLFEEDPMPVLEKLPKLRSLQLHICYRGREINCSDKAFPELTYLALDGLFSLQNWNVKKGGFPKLLEIAIYNCPLQKIPDILSPNVHIMCNADLQPLVDEFRRQSKASEDASSELPFWHKQWQTLVKKIRGGQNLN